jgi:hypothetical protein
VATDRAPRPRARTKDASFVVVTGVSGAGKSHAIRALEDLGYFCVDNLPIALLPTFADLTLNASGNARRAAVVIDVREGRELVRFPAVYRKLQRQARQRIRLLFLVRPAACCCAASARRGGRIRWRADDRSPRALPKNGVCSSPCGVWRIACWTPRR